MGNQPRGHIGETKRAVFSMGRDSKSQGISMAVLLVWTILNIYIFEWTGSCLRIFENVW